MKVVVQSFSDNPTQPKNGLFEAEFASEPGPLGWKRLLQLEPLDSTLLKSQLNLPVLHSGFVDSHLHLSWMGEQLSSLRASSYRTFDEFLRAALKEFENTNASEVVSFFNWDESLWGLDVAAAGGALAATLPRDRKWVFFRICGHKAFVSATVKREALQLKEMAPSWIDTEKLFRVYSWLEESRAGKVEQFILKAQEALLSVGINAVSDMALDASKTLGLENLLQSGKLSMDVAGVLLSGTSNELELRGPFMKTAATPSPFLGGPAVLSCRHWKKFLDGSFGARTAWLSQPYQDDPANFGRDMCEIRELLGGIEEALNRGFHLSFHAIGDAAVDRILEIEEMLQHLLTTRRKMKASDRMPPVWHRIEHGQLLRDDQVLRLGESANWIVCAQPFHRIMDEPFIEKRLGSDRLRACAYRYESLLAAGIPILMGSDAPIGEESPEKILHSVLSHDNPAERPSWYQALWLYTQGSRHFLGLPPRPVRTGELVWLSENPLA
jgi:predicted amidohydrolase YtcJ